MRVATLPTPVYAQVHYVKISIEWEISRYVLQIQLKQLATALTMEKYSLKYYVSGKVTNGARNENEMT